MNIKKKYTIEDMQHLAYKKNGKCLSNDYLGTDIKLLWQCFKGHSWESTPHKIRAGRWCPICAGILPLNLEIMKDLAAKHGGKCLSSEYKNNYTKLEWECSNGHIFNAFPYSIRNHKRWCPVCRRSRV